MPSQTTLIENNHIMRTELIDPWTVEEILAESDRSYMIRNKFPHRIHTLLICTQTTRLPSRAVNLHAVSPFTHPRRGQVVMVGAKVMLQSLVGLFSTLHGFKDDLHLFATEDEALDHLRKVIAAES